MHSLTTIVAGIDVSKANLDVDLAPETHATSFVYDDRGLSRLIEWLGKHKVHMVVLEATGGLERPLMRALAAADIPFHLANPRQIRDFARATGKLAKTDRIDARVIAQFGYTLRPKPTVLPSENRRKLIAAVTRYEQIKQMRVAESNRLDRTEDPDMRAMIEQMIGHLDEQLRQLDERLEQLIQVDPDMQRDADTITTMPGIGRLTASRLVAMLPELGRCNRRQIARLIGVAPINRDSGTMRGRRTTGGGRAVLRNMLYMPTLVAVRHNPRIRQIYQHLLEQGKPKMVAIIAAMRQLIILLNIMIREQKTWKQIHQTT